MAKEKSDKATKDIFNPYQRGGYRAGSGRPKSKGPAKKKIGWHVSLEAIDNIESLAKNMDYSASELLDYIMKRAKKAPERLD